MTIVHVDSNYRNKCKAKTDKALDAHNKEQASKPISQRVYKDGEKTWKYFTNNQIGLVIVSLFASIVMFYYWVFGYALYEYMNYIPEQYEDVVCIAICSWLTFIIAMPVLGMIVGGVGDIEGLIDLHRGGQSQFSYLSHDTQVKLRRRGYTVKEIDEDIYRVTR